MCAGFHAALQLLPALLPLRVRPALLEALVAALTPPGHPAFATRSESTAGNSAPGWGCPDLQRSAEGGSSGLAPSGLQWALRVCPTQPQAFPEEKSSFSCYLIPSLLTLQDCSQASFSLGSFSSRRPKCAVPKGANAGVHSAGSCCKSHWVRDFAANPTGA